MIAGQVIIAAGAPAEQMRLCAQLVSSAPVEHKSPCLVLQEHLALKQATHIKTTAPSAHLDTTVKVEIWIVEFCKKSNSAFLHSVFNNHTEGNQ